MTKDGLLENLIDQILNDNDLLILIDDLQDDVNLTAIKGVLLAEFAVREDQLIQLYGNGLVEEAVWATLADDTDTI